MRLSRTTAVRVESLTSLSSTTTFGRAPPSAASASPNASRVATELPGLVAAAAAAAPAGNACGRCRWAGGSHLAPGLSRMPPSSLMAWSGSGSGLPCAPSVSSTAATPRPLRVRARMTVGRPVVPAASASARSISATDARRSRWCASRSAAIRRAYAAVSQPCRVGPRWPSRFTSMITVRLSSPVQAACSNASQIDPSASSLSPHRTQTRYGSWSRNRPAMASPTPAGRPSPSDPVATSTQGSRGVGCPSSRLPGLPVTQQFPVGDRARCPEHRV